LKTMRHRCAVSGRLCPCLAHSCRGFAAGYMKPSAKGPALPTCGQLNGKRMRRLSDHVLPFCQPASRTALQT
jgi:hypothetical protein